MRALIAAGHHNERSAFHTGRTAGYRCVDPRHIALLAEAGRKTSGRFGFDARMIDQHLSGAATLSDAIRSEDDGLHSVRVGHAEEDNVARLRDRAGTRCRDSSLLKRGLEFLFAAPPHCYPIASIQHLQGNRCAHQAEADESNTRGHSAAASEAFSP